MKFDEIFIGCTIRMRSPDSMLGVIPCYVMAITDNPENASDDYKVITYRYWSKYKKRWFWKAYPYWELSMLNNW